MRVNHPPEVGRSPVLLRLPVFGVLYALATPPPHGETLVEMFSSWVDGAPRPLPAGNTNTLGRVHHFSLKGTRVPVRFGEGNNTK